MATNIKRSWKFQEFHSNCDLVNCLSFGQKSGNIYVTGGEDKKIYLWAVGKSNYIVKFSGHTSPVETVKFNPSEELIASGSQSGTIKIFDLQTSKIFRTLSGHKANVTSLDFHPFGNIIASGSLDTNIKLWDIRKKGVIYSYKGHETRINCIRFSPDGRWIASGSNNAIKLWDITKSKQLGDFPENSDPIMAIEFHPTDFLLASGGQDKTVKFWELETFEMICTSDSDTSTIRNLLFHPDGNCLYATTDDFLKVYTWEPCCLLDSINIGWGKPADIVIQHNKLTGASIQQNNISIFLADLLKIQPFSNTITSETNTLQNQNFVKNVSKRRSFISSPPKNVLPNNESDSKNKIDNKDVFINDNQDSEPKLKDKMININKIYKDNQINDIDDFNDYNKIFCSKRELARDLPNKTSNNNNKIYETCDDMQNLNFKPPSQLKPPGSFQKTSTPKINDFNVSTEIANIQLESNTNSFNKNHLIDNSVLNFSNNQSQNSLKDDQLYLTNVIEVKDKELQINVAEKESCLTFPNKNKNIDNDLKRVNYNQENKNVYFHDKYRNECISKSINELEVDILPTFDNFSEEKVLDSITSGFNIVYSALTGRFKKLNIIKSQWVSGNLKLAIISTLAMNDYAILQDIINILLQKQSFWTLDYSALILPGVSKLISSQHENYFKTGLNAVRFILRTFSVVIKDCISNYASIGVDISKEERYNKSISCHKILMQISEDLNNKNITCINSLQLKEIKILLDKLENFV